MQTTKSDRNLGAFLWIVLGILGRLIPHPPNMTPMIPVALFGGSQLSRGRAFAVTFCTMAVSDAILAAVGRHQVFGYWSLFTYSGFALVVLAGMALRTVPTAGRTLGFLLASSLFFWVWTNFGVWISGDGYPRTAEGLVSCYVAAIPFLGNALIGDLGWGLALFLSFHFLRKAAPRFGIAVQGA